MGFFLFTKMGADGGQQLEAILARREFERKTGQGVFWWAIGNSLGLAVSERAKEQGGVLPVIFSRMPSKSHRRDTHPSEIMLWPQWQDADGTIHEVPGHILLWSQGADLRRKQKHFALVCHSDDPVRLGDHGPFHPARCKTHRGRQPGSSQVTALLHDDSSDSHTASKSQFGFRASLIEPWFVTLVNPQPLPPSLRAELSNWPTDDNDWASFKSGIASYCATPSHLATLRQ